MDNFFNQFDKDMDLEFLNAVSDIEKLNSELKFDKVPDGTYRVGIEYMTIKKSKKGNLMLQTGYKILSGQFEKNIIWSYFLLNNIEFVNSFLKSLNTEIDVKYENINQYKDMVSDVLLCSKGWKEYDLNISTNRNGYSTYKILTTYEKEQEELPFS